MADGTLVALPRSIEHVTTLTDIGDLFGFWCSCGRSTVGWRLRYEAEDAAKSHEAGGRPYGTCIYCNFRAVLTRFGWCEICHPRLAESRTVCRRCDRSTKRGQLSREGFCGDCVLEIDRLREWGR